MRGIWSIIRDLIEVTIVLLVIISVCGVCAYAFAWAGIQLLGWIFRIS